MVVPLNHYSDQMPSRRWYKLLNKKGEDDGIRRGDLELVIHWKYNSQKSAAKRGRFMKWIMSESDEESGEVDYIPSLE